MQDYKGQKLAEQIFQGIILVSAVSNTGSTLKAITTLSFLLCLTSFILQVIGFVYGLFIQQFGWTVYIMLAGFTVSCLVCHKDFCLLDVKFQKSSCNSVSCSSAHPASLADVQKKPSELAAGRARDIWRKPWQTSGESESEEEEVQVIPGTILVGIRHSKAI